MSNQNHQSTKQEEQKKDSGLVVIKNESARPITLIVSQDDKATVLPGQETEVSKEFMEAIKKNKAAMTFFNPKELVIV